MFCPLHDKSHLHAPAFQPVVAKHPTLALEASALVAQQHPLPQVGQATPKALDHIAASHIRIFWQTNGKCAGQAILESV